MAVSKDHCRRQLNNLGRYEGFLCETDKQTHIRGDPCTVFDCVALYGDVVDLSVSVGENKMLPG